MMAAAGMTSFNTLSDEMALKIIKMAATPKSQSQTLITMAANKKLGDGEMHSIISITEQVFLHESGLETYLSWFSGILRIII